MKRIPHFIIAVLLILVAFTSISSIGDDPVNWDWTIDGDIVFVNNSVARLSITPHTLLSSGSIECELELKADIGSLNIDCAFGFDTSTAKPRSMEIWWNYSHTMTGYHWVEQYLTMNLTVISGYSLGIENYDNYSDIIGNKNNTKLWMVNYTWYDEMIEEWSNHSIVLAFTSQNHTDANYTFYYYDEIRESYQYESWFWDWKPFSKTPEITHKDILNSTTQYYFRNLTIQQDKRYKVRIWIELPFGGLEGLPKSKYWWALKPSSETIQQAIDNNHLVLLDPWWGGDVTSYSYMKNIYISNKWDEYQMKINVSKTSGGDVDCEGHCQDDFGDLRFVHDNTSVIPYWFEYISSGNYVVAWVNNSYNDSCIQMYYGTSGASTTTSEGNDTWDLYQEWTNDYTGDYTQVKHATLHIYGQFNDQNANFRYNVTPPFRYLCKWEVNTWTTTAGSADAYHGFSAMDATDYYGKTAVYMRTSADTDAGAGATTMACGLCSRVSSSGTNSAWDTFTFSTSTWYVTDIHVSSTSYAEGQIFPVYHTDVDVLSTTSTTSNIPSSLDINYFGERIPYSTTDHYWNYGTDVIEYGGYRTSYSFNELFTPWTCVGKFNASGVTPPTFSSFGAEEAIVVWSNTAPTFSSEYPTNQTTNIGEEPMCYVTISDVDGNSTAVDFYTSIDGITWTHLPTEHRASHTANTTAYFNYTTADNYQTKYYWKVTANDTHDNSTAEYEFTTGEWGWATNWTYHKTITVTNKIDDYQMEINITKTSGGDIDCEGHCNDNFSDIRFIYNNATALPYWIETGSVNNGNYATFWVNNSGNYSNFDMYYGNSNVVNNSDGDTTFDFFDEFTGSDIDTTIWDEEVDTTFTVTSGVMKAERLDSDDWDFLNSTSTFYRPCAVETLSKHTVAGSGEYAQWGFREGTLGDDHANVDVNSGAPGLERLISYDEGSGVVVGESNWITDTTAFHRRSILWYPHQVDFLYEGTQCTGSPITATVPVDESENLIVGVYEVDLIWYFDWFAIRKLNNTGVSVPSLSYGNEQPEAWSNTAPTFSSPSPVNESTGQSVQPTVTVIVTDADGNNSECDFYTSIDGSSWTHRQHNSTVLNETIRYAYTQASNSNTKYYWKVSANDVHDNSTVEYEFTTTANMVSDDGTHYVVTTNKFVAKIDKNHGDIPSLKIVGNANELAQDTSGFQPWFPEYQNLAGIVFNTENNAPDITVSVPINTSTEASILCVWNNSYQNITWYFNFTKTDDYFDIWSNRNIKTADVYSNAQQCHMFSDYFSTGGWTDYNGTILEEYIGWSDNSVNKNLVGSMKRLSMQSALNNNFYSFVYVNRTTSPYGTIAVALNDTSDNIWHSISRNRVTKLTATNDWEFQWNFFNNYDNDGIYLESGLNYWIMLHVIIVNGSVDDAKTVNQAIYQAPTEPDTKDMYYIASESRRYWTGSGASRNSVMVHSANMSISFDSRTSFGSSVNILTLSPFWGNITNNPVIYNITRGDTSIFPNNIGDSYGHSSTANYKEGYIVKTVGGTTSNLTARVYSNGGGEDILHLIHDITSGGYSGIYFNFTMGWNHNDYAITSLGNDKYQVDYEDEYDGTKTFYIVPLVNISSSNSTSSMISFNPSQDRYGINISLYAPNNAPTITGEIPANQSTGISTIPQLNVTVDDADDDYLNVTWRSNSSGTWTDFNYNSSLPGDSLPTNISQTNSNFSAYSTLYYWSINISDGTTWTNETYHFTTTATVIDVEVSPTTWNHGNADVNTNIQENFTFYQNGSATIDITIGTNATNYTFVNYTGWLNLGHDRYCANYTTDNWASESMIEPGYPPTSILKSGFSPGSFTFGVRIWMPRTVTYANKREDFEITLVVSESS